MADYNSDRTGSNIDLTLDKVDALDAKVQPTATGVDVTGTVSADALEASTASGVTATSGGNTARMIGAGAGTYFGSATNTPVIFQVNQNEKARIDSNGYVGINTSTPSTGLMLEHSNNGATRGTIRIKDSDSQQVDNQLTGAIEFESQDASIPTSGVSTAIKSYVKSTSGGAYLTFSTTDQFTSTLDERMRIDHDGNVGIGTDSPTSFGGGYKALEVKGSTATGGGIFRTSTSDGSVIGDFYSYAGGVILESRSTDPLRFYTNNSESARIDSSGNLLVGTTDADIRLSSDSEGVAIQNDRVTASRASGASADFNRFNTDGAIAQFRKNGSVVGTIGNENSLGVNSVYLSSALGTGITFGSNSLIPTNSNGNVSSATKDLGATGFKWKDLYLSGGVYLGGTGSVNKLDDYEEGNFTPNDNNLDYTSRVGRYEKIGRLVHVQGFFVVPTNTNANEADISLPFLYNEAGTHYLVCDVSTTNGTLSGIKGRLDSQGSGGQYIHIVNADETRVLLSELSGKSIRFSATYRTDS